MGSPYVKTPEVPAEVAPLYEAVLKVLAGYSTQDEAAEALGLSRVQFQSVMHRGLAGLLGSLRPQKRGRKATPEAEKELRAKVERLERENAQLKAQVERTSRMMGLASEWMRRGLEASPRQRRSKPPKATPVPSADDEEPAAALAAIDELRGAGVPAGLACAAVGVSPATARRWRHRRGEGRALVQPRGPRPVVEDDGVACGKVAELLRDTRGCMGAEPLAHATGLSRRAAARAKAECLTAAEHERRAAATRVSVVPGVMRGFDAVDVSGTPVLVSADAGVPYRTSVFVAQRYDAQAVAEALARDFAANGAPLVWRVDRWKAHETSEVRAVLEANGVLLLHGPPRHPRFYGQLERQNREHRTWFDARQGERGPALRASCERMVEAFNELVPRRRLRWLTAGEVWRARAEVAVDRRELQEEVEERVARMKEQEAHRVAYPGFVERLAIEAALIKRGLLRLQRGGWC